MAAQIYSDITDTVGEHPLVRLNRVTDGAGATVLAKLEFYNPAGSVKDRIGVAIIDAAEESGELKPGGTIVEATSGNTGIALALVGAARGYKVILTMPETDEQGAPRAAARLRRRARAHPRRRGHARRGREGQRDRRQTPTARSWPASSRTRRTRPSTARPPAEEIWADTDGDVDIFVAGIGTGGTITGVGQVLKERKPGVQIIAVEPIDSPILTGGAPGPHKIQGIGANFVPEILDRDVYDEVIDVTLADSVAIARALATEEGILAGISGGAAVWAALEQAKRPENAGKTIVVIVPDFGERYISTVLYEDLLD